MKKVNCLFVLAVLLACTGAAIRQGERPLPQRTISEALDSWITNTERHLVPVADVMPEEKYSFAPASTSGEFRGVRTFAQQLKHLAANNYLMAAFILGKKGSAEPNNETGPESIRTKAEIMEYLRGSFVALHEAVATIDNHTVVEPMASPSSWQKTRLSFALDAVAHSFEHYGQVVEYLRMNGIIPPDSRSAEGAKK